MHRVERRSAAHSDFDFSEWSELARNDPAAFEARRRATIEEMLERMPEARRDRLRRLQWKVDQVRRLADNPMSACLRISRMMWDSLLEQQRFIEGMRELDGAGLPLPEAQVLAFPGGRGNDSGLNA